MTNPSWLIARTEIPQIFMSKYVKYSAVSFLALDTILPITLLFFGQAEPVPVEVYQLMIDSMVVPMILLIPAILPLLIAAQSLIGEKEKRTLEPLLATPLTTNQLLLGKILTALVPGLVILVISTIFSYVLVQLSLSMSGVVGVVFPTLSHILLIAIDGPLLSLLAVTSMVLVSSRVDTVYSAYQIGGTVTLPAFLPMALAFVLADPTGLMNFAITTAVIGVLNIAFFKIAVSIFDRDRMISRV